MRSAKRLCCRALERALVTLQAVDRLVIGKKDVGEVAFIGSVDLRGLVLDDIVDIDKGKIQVYGLPGGAQRPAVGQGLNKPALLSFRCAVLQMPCRGMPQQCKPNIAQQQHHHQQHASLGSLLSQEEQPAFRLF